MAQKTFEIWVPQSLVPALGWQAVYHAEDGSHFLAPLYMLALAQHRVKACATGDRVPLYRGMVDDEGWDIVGVGYSPADGWSVENESGNYCGLLPPDWTLADYEAARGCGAPAAPPMVTGAETGRGEVRVVQEAETAQSTATS